MRRKAELSTSADKPEQLRDRHGHRGLPPPAEFDIAALPDSALLNEREAGAILRISTNTLGSWRRQIDHPLKWTTLPNGLVRYQVLALRAFLSMGQPRSFKPKLKGDTSPPATDEAARKPSRPRPHRRRLDQVEVEAP
jgi:hypothetical protein